MKKKAPELHQVHLAVLQVLHPEQVEVEMGRSEALDRRRGLTSELDARWSDVRCNVSFLPILEQDEQFPRVICIHDLLCSHYKINY
jgi:hypothetical protein